MLAGTTDYRYGGIVTTALAQPRRTRLVMAKVSATALVAATGGAAMSLDAAPQRLAREAVFYLVQAQTPPVRQAVLQLWRDSGA